MRVELSDDIWKNIGFKKERCNGGYDRWYHNEYLGRDVIFFKKGASISEGYLTFNCNNPKEENPKTLKELYLVILEALKESSYKQGVEANQQELKNALGIYN